MVWGDKFEEENGECMMSSIYFYHSVIIDLWFTAIATVDAAIKWYPPPPL